MIRRLILISIYSALPFLAGAQDPLFSQFYHSPLYLNPAFTGCGKNDFRACFSNRIQWLNLPAPMQYYSLSADKYYSDRGISTGLIMNRFSEGYIKTTQMYATLAKNLGSDGYDDREWFFNFAMQIGFNILNVDKSKLLFADQIDQNGINGLPSQVELFKYAGRAHVDISTGALLTFRNVMLGVSGQHIANTHNGLIDFTNTNYLPKRYTVHLSCIIDNQSEKEGAAVIKPTIIFNKQGLSKSFLLGTLIDLPDHNIEFSLWYRNNWDFKDNHSLVLGINIKFGQEKNYYNSEGNKRVRAGFSYDGELNSPGVRHTSGSSEIGMLYESPSETCPRPSGKSRFVRFPWEFH